MSRASEWTDSVKAVPGDPGQHVIGTVTKFVLRVDGERLMISYWDGGIFHSCLIAARDAVTIGRWIVDTFEEKS